MKRRQSHSKLNSIHETDQRRAIARGLGPFLCPASCYLCSLSWQGRNWHSQSFMLPKKNENYKNGEGRNIVEACAVHSGNAGGNRVSMDNFHSSILIKNCYRRLLASRGIDGTINPFEPVLRRYVSYRLQLRMLGKWCLQRALSPIQFICRTRHIRCQENPKDPWVAGGVTSIYFSTVSSE